MSDYKDRSGNIGKGQRLPAINGISNPKRDAVAARTNVERPAAGLSGDKKVSGFDVNVWNVMDEAGNLLLSKHRDYGPLNISRSPGGPVNGLRVRMWDKIARINHLVDSGVAPEHESLRDSFMDLLNYSAIAIMVLNGTWPTE